MLSCAAVNVDTSPDPDSVGQEMHALIARLYPLCRSMTGNGVRQTLEILREYIPLQVREVASGTQVFDWTVPKEWNIRDAYIKSPAGERVVDFHKCNLHVVSYSVPVQETMSLERLQSHLFTVPGHVDWIPYRTSYFKDTWGFCLSHRQMMALEDGTYEVLIDSSLENGHLTYGELFLPGATNEEVLISTHLCHPSLCNDNLSGISVATLLARRVSAEKRKYSYRFLFIPATIGSITWLAQNEGTIARIKHGLVLACLGDDGKSTYKKTPRGDAEIDRAVLHVLKHSGAGFSVNDFVPYGYDERQYCSPGFDLPVGCLMRTAHGCFPEYHTSADNLDFVQPASLADSLAKCIAVLSVLEGNAIYINQNPKCEPQLGRRGIYRPYAEQKDRGKKELALLWVLNQSDGSNSLLDIAERAGIRFEEIKEAADLLVKHDLLKEKVT